MKYIIALIAALALHAQAEEPAVIPPEIVRACQQAGGCVIVPETVLEQELQKAFDAGRAEEAKKQNQCLKNTV